MLGNYQLSFKKNTKSTNFKGGSNYGAGYKYYK